MNGIFSDLLKSCAGWFLYVFVAPDAPFNNSIMTKRANQITWLKRLDALNPTYTYSDLVNIVHAGIVEQYGKTPVELLTEIYNTAINGIGNLDDAWDNRELEDDKPKKKNFWDSLKGVLDYVLELISMLGFGRTSDIQPLPSDWNRPYKESSMLSMDSLISLAPYLVGAGIIIFALRNRE